MKRRPMSSSGSKRSFTRNSGHHPMNQARIMRGGYRL